MEKALIQYSHWLKEILAGTLRDELVEIKNNPEEIYDRFCREISFGTSGLRGKMGAGTNRINSVVVKRATRGIAQYLKETQKRPAMVLSYDTRLHSKEFAEITAQTLKSCGIDAYIMASPQPVPLLSYTVRALKLSGGIMITASHNPKEYNGYKVYDHFGNQIDDKKARLIEDYIGQQPYFTAETETVTELGQIITISDEILAGYIEEISSRALWWTNDLTARSRAMDRLNVVYTPLNGTGLPHVLEIFNRLGLKQVDLVERQTIWDGAFRTCPTPNPESLEAFNEALAEYGQEKADLIIATDPDSDRMGVMVYDGDVYVHLSGNQVGVLLLDYICQCIKSQEGADKLCGKYVYKSIVSTPLIDKIAAAYGINVESTLTGFKNIAVKIEALCRKGREQDFLFGFEESLGYLYGTYTRDKDGVMACQLICLAAARCKSLGITLSDRLNQIHQEYGFIESRTDALYFTMEKDREVMDSIMKRLFHGDLKTVNEKPVKMDTTYQKENVFQGEILEGDGRVHRFILRPSGTELKLKMYVFAEGTSRQAAGAKAAAMIEEIKRYLVC